PPAPFLCAASIICIASRQREERSRTGDTNSKRQRGENISSFTLRVSAPRLMIPTRSVSEASSTGLDGNEHHRFLNEDNKHDKIDSPCADYVGFSDRFSRIVGLQWDNQNGTSQ